MRKRWRATMVWCFHRVIRLCARSCAAAKATNRAFRRVWSFEAVAWRVCFHLADARFGTPDRIGTPNQNSRRTWSSKGGGHLGIQTGLGHGQRPHPTAGSSGGAPKADTRFSHQVSHAGRHCDLRVRGHLRTGGNRPRDLRGGRSAYPATGTLGNRNLRAQ